MYYLFTDLLELEWPKSLYFSHAMMEAVIWKIHEFFLCPSGKFNFHTSSEAWAIISPFLLAIDPLFSL